MRRIMILLTCFSLLVTATLAARPAAPDAVAARNTTATGASVGPSVQAAASTSDVLTCPDNGTPTYISDRNHPCVRTTSTCVRTTSTYANATTYDDAVACNKTGDKNLKLIAEPGQTVGCDESTTKTTTVSISDSFETGLGLSDSPSRRPCQLARRAR